MARAIGSRCDATTSATVWSSALMRSTISSGVARSMSAVRGLRRSVSRGSMNVMSLANLRGVERDPQQQEDRMLRRTLCSMLLFCAATPAVVHAQIGRRPSPPTEPGYWVGLSIGYVEGMTTTDDATGAIWRFGYTSQVRATVEKTLSQGMTLGVAAGYSNAPLTYSSTGQFTGACAGSCLANADITQYLAF